MGDSAEFHLLEINNILIWAKRINQLTYIVSVLHSVVVEQRCTTLWLRICSKQNKMQTFLKLSYKQANKKEIFM